MNELIVNADGTVTCVGDAGSVSGILAKRVKAATIPATHDDDGVELTPEIVPDADTLAQAVTSDELKVHEWRLPKVRAERLEQLRGMRDAKLNKIDDELKDNLIGRPGANRTKDNSAEEKQKLRDLPDSMGPALDAMTNTDDMEAYTPDEVK